MVLVLASKIPRNHKPKTKIMKKWIVLTVLITVGMMTVNAQNLSFGAKAGVNFANLKPDLDDASTRTSFHLGAVAEIGISDKFSVQPELLYSEQGAKDESDDDEVVRTNYLTLPILAKYYLTDGLSLEAGPQIGFLLTAEVEDDGDTIDLKDNTKGTDIGFAFGLGYKLDSGLNFGLRYFLGSDINDVDGDSDKISNRVFQLSLGYFF